MKNEKLVVLLSEFEAAIAKATDGVMGAAKRSTPKRKRKPRTLAQFMRKLRYAPIQRFYPTKREAETMTTEQYVEAFLKANHYAV
jgi:hypothetical protein